MIEALLLAASLVCVEPEPPSATAVESVLQTGWPSGSVYGNTAPYNFLTLTEPSKDSVLSYRVYVDPLYESYTSCFGQIVDNIVTDSRGWGHVRRADPGEPPQLWIVLAPPGVARCGENATPYGSCARGASGHGHVYINAGRWMVGYHPVTSLENSRIQIINHEVGHILGFDHMDCTVMGYFPIHPDVEGGNVEEVGWDTCPPPIWPTRLVADTHI